MSELEYLCSCGDWRAVIERCKSHPHEACPRSMIEIPKILTNAWADDGSADSRRNFDWPAHPCFFSPGLNSAAQSASNEATTFRMTALGYACAYRELNQGMNYNTMREKAILCLAEICPKQVRCSQITLGHTPLRAALQDLPSCSAQMLQGLLQADRPSHPSQLSSSIDHDQNETEQMCSCQQGCVQTDKYGIILSPAILTTDEEGLYPLDHILSGVHHGAALAIADTDILHSLSLLKVFIDQLKFSPSLPQQVVDQRSRYDESRAEFHMLLSPLIRFLSIRRDANFNRYRFSTWETHDYSDDAQDTANVRMEVKNQRLEQTRVAIRLVLQQASNCLTTTKTTHVRPRKKIDPNDNDTALPSLAQIRSNTTRCTILHLALQHFGTCKSIIDDIVQHDIYHELMEERNAVGNLPLHVACQIGSSFDVLRLVLERTFLRRQNIGIFDLQPCERENCCFNPDPLIWSTNRWNHTPVDLEWIRFIEVGNGSQPLQQSSTRDCHRKSDAYYEKLWEEAVDQVILAGATTGLASNSDPVSFEEKKMTVQTSFGPLLERIATIIEAATYQTFSDDPYEKLLHGIAHLCSPLQHRCLPLPLMRLFVWLLSERIQNKDCWGKMPIHYAVQIERVGNLQQCSKEACDGWQSFVLGLLGAHRCFLLPGTHPTKLCDSQGHSPLHLLLRSNGFTQEKPVEDNQQAVPTNTENSSDAPINQTAIATALSTVVQHLVELEPDAVDTRDPTSNLFPFMQAACCPLVPVDTVYYLLQKSPTLLTVCITLIK